MELKKEDTKGLLMDGFHSLMLSHDFEKITIKMITDAANVIRPTFYYYFEDKYDLLSQLLYRDIFSQVEMLTKLNMDTEGVKSIFLSIERDLKFYQKAFLIVTPISFEHMFYENCYAFFLDRADHYSLRTMPNYRLLTKSIVAKYYTLGLVSIIKEWVSAGFIETEDNQKSAQDIFAAYEFLISHSIFDIIRRD